MIHYHVHHRFHPVGHGTFFTGEVAGSDGGVFRWVYDCGSRSTRRIEEEINRLSAWRGFPDSSPIRWEGEMIDMVVVSHFDGDHVNGLEQLLQNFRVGWLVLPWLGLRHRLAHALSLGDREGASSAAIAGLAIDPHGFLAARGLSDRVEQIMLVQGVGNSEDSADEPLPLPVPGQHEPTIGGGSLYGAKAGFELHYPAEGTTSGSRSAVVSHAFPFRMGSAQSLELMFFNTSPPDGTANRSKQSIDVVRAEVDQVLRHYNVLDPRGKQRPGWRVHLRRCYDKHFGTSGAERNNISLCALVRPLAEVQRHCDRFCWCGGCFCCWGWDRSTGKRNGNGLLLTGDITLDNPTIDAMQRHFSAARWQGLGLVQVPHHGSRHSWFAGNSARFCNPEFVHCVPSESGKYPRPHPHVMADLAQSSVLHADDSVGVSQCYVI